MGILDPIANALTGKQGDVGATNKKGYNLQQFQANPNIQKMKDLGMSAMPEDGQEGLDKMYSEFQARKAAQGKDKKKSNVSKLYKDQN